MRRARKGHVLAELSITMGLVGIVTTASTSLILGAARSMDRTTAQVDVDSYATIGIQRMMEDLREAKRVEIVSPSHLRIYYPVVDPATGRYDCTQEDPDNTIEFYRADTDGTANAEGETIWRRPAGQTGWAILRRPTSGNDPDARPRVADLLFESDNPSSVDVTLRITRGSASGNTECHLLHRAIFLRNYTAL